MTTAETAAAQPPEGGQPSGQSGTVYRTVRVLSAIAESAEPLSLTELGRILQLPTSTLHRLTGLLREQGLVTVDPRTKLYSPGEELVRMSMLLTSRHSITDIARPVLQHVVDQCGETAQLSRWLPTRQVMVIVDKVNCSHPLRFTLPLHEPLSVLWGSSGRVILANLAPDLVEQIWATEGTAPATAVPKASLAATREQLATIRTQGWDRTDGEKLRDAVGFAAPVFDATGIFGSVSVPVPTVRYEPAMADNLVAVVVDAASRISHLLAGDPSVSRHHHS